MFSLQRILGHDKKFFDLLEASATEAQASVQALKHVLESPNPAPSLAEFSALRRKDKKITNEITDMLCRTFVTALEREDIETLAVALYKIPKTIEKFAERHLLTADKTRDVNFMPQVLLLEKATTTIREMVRELHTQNLQRLMELNAVMQTIETQGDELLAELTGEIYRGKYDPIKSIYLKDLFELLEKVVDRCRSAGHIMNRVALKHS